MVILKEVADFEVFTAEVEAPMGAHRRATCTFYAKKSLDSGLNLQICLGTRAKLNRLTCFFIPLASRHSCLPDVGFLGCLSAICFIHFVVILPLVMFRAFPCHAIDLLGMVNRNFLAFLYKLNKFQYHHC